MNTKMNKRSDRKQGIPANGADKDHRNLMDRETEHPFFPFHFSFQHPTL